MLDVELSLCWPGRVPQWQCTVSYSHLVLIAADQVTVRASMSNASDTVKLGISFDSHSCYKSRNGGSRERIYQRVEKDDFNKRKNLGRKRMVRR